MAEKRRLPDAELEVMQIVWHAGQPVTSGYVQEHAAQDWKATSVLTFLSRLCEKGFLSREKCGKQNFYAPLVDESSYLQQESASFLQHYYPTINPCALQAEFCLAKRTFACFFTRGLLETHGWFFTSVESCA